MSELQVNDVICGKYVDNSNRYFKVMKVTPQKVKVQRLKYRRGPSGEDLGPSTTAYGPELIMTKKDDLSATHYGMICTRM